jgi:protein TonB
MSVSDWAIAMAALAASLLLHGLLLYNTGSVAGNEEPLAKERTVTRVSFRSVAAPQTLPQPPQPDTEKPPEPEVTEAPEPPPEPEPPKPEKRAEKTRQSEPAPKPPQEPTRSPPVESSAEAEKTPAAAEAVSGTVQDPALIEQARQEYLRRLMAHIESHKSYPRAARRRRLEGDVRVTFSLQGGGRVAALQAEGGHRLLTGAASEAVERAVPLPPPPESLSLPWEVAFTMRFSLN